MIVDYELLTARVDELLLPDEVKEQARAMAGELATTLTPDRERVLVGAAHAVEAHCNRGFWGGVGGNPRASTAELRIHRPGEIPLLASLSDTQGAVLAVVSVGLWSNSAEAYEDAPYSLRPAGRIEVSSGGNYRIEVTFAPGEAPAVAVEACARVYAYMTQHRPSGRSLASSGEIFEPPRLQGSLQRSGAAGLLRHLRRYRA